MLLVSVSLVLYGFCVLLGSSGSSLSLTKPLTSELGSVVKHCGFKLVLLPMSRIPQMSFCFRLNEKKSIALFYLDCLLSLIALNGISNGLMIQRVKCTICKLNLRPNAKKQQCMQILFDLHQRDQWLSELGPSMGTQDKCDGSKMYVFFSFCSIFTVFIGKNLMLSPFLASKN